MGLGVTELRREEQFGCRIEMFSENSLRINVGIIITCQPLAYGSLATLSNPHYFAYELRCRCWLAKLYIVQFSKGFSFHF